MGIERVDKRIIEVRTQKELENALGQSGGGRDALILCVGGGHFVLWGSSSAELRGSSSAVLRESSSARLFSADGKVRATKFAVVMRYNPAAKVRGGRILEMPRPQTAAEWCEFYGVEIRKGGKYSKRLAGKDVAILFKAVKDGYVSGRGVCYRPGSKPKAPDWDGGRAECGGGLHFSPHPKMARDFCPGAKHYVACPVLVKDIVVHPDGNMPYKVKAPRVVGSCYEVNLKGERV